MRIIIAGSRTFNDYGKLKLALRDLDIPMTEIVSGGAKGADALGERYAQENGIPLTRFPADWEKHGKPAGVIRNKQMAKYGEVLVAAWDGQSRGTKNMIDEAKKQKLLIYYI